MIILEFYTIKKDTIQICNELTQEDIVIIIDGKAGYIWKGENAVYLDESDAKKVEKRIFDRFKAIDFQLIPELKQSPKDNPKLIQIKQEIRNRLPGKISKIKMQSISFLNKIKKNFSEFKNYEKSWKWREKLSNLTNLWKLSLFNVVFIIISILLMLNNSIFLTIHGDINLLISLIFLSVVFFLNLTFLLFPMRFPIEVIDVYNTDGGEKIMEPMKEGKSDLPPEPKLPQIQISGSKKKERITQIEIGPLKPSKRKTTNKKAKKGSEYLTSEDAELSVPKIPEAPKKKPKITVKSPGISTEILEEVKKLENSNTEVVLVNCERCKGIIPVPIPKAAVLKSKLPIVPISYVHTEKRKKDKHCLTLFLDKDFDIRRQRISDVI